jgi:PAS domain S-box-containing protein
VEHRPTVNPETVATGRGDAAGGWNLDQQIIANVDDGLIVADREMRYLAWNRAMERISGLPAAEVLGKNGLEMFPFLREIGFEALFRRALAGETLTTPDFPFEVPATGVRGWSSQTMAPLRTAGGDIIGVITTVRDVTARNWAERRERQHVHVLELLTAHAPLSTILDFIARSVEDDDPGALCSILLVDESGQRLVHAAAPNLPPSYVRAIDGLPVGDCVGACGTAAFRRERVVLDDVRTHPYGADFREVVERAGLRACWSQPILSADRTVLGTFATYRRQPHTPSAREIESVEAAAGYACLAVERTRAEEQRRRLEARVRNSQKLESLGVLAGGIAHDFNNLLTVVLSYADLARNQLPDDSPVRPLIKEIDRAAERAAELAKQMLAYSGRGTFLIGAVHVDTVVAEMAKLLATVISKKAELRLDLRPATIEGDATQVRQVVMNLITNASDALEDKSGFIALRTGVRAMDAADLRSSVLLEPLPPGTYAYVEVQDTGCGMSEATLSRMFDPFFTTKTAGRGLGLSAVVGIVRGHHGTLHVDTRPGAGTTFRIVFPAVGEGRPVDRPAITPSGSGVSTGTVLVVDDEPAVNKLACDVLRRAGFLVVSAADGREGVTLYERYRQQIQAIVLDLSMPHLSGIEVATRVRELNPEVPILFTSGYNQQESSERLAEIGRSGFLQKPFRPSELRASVRGMLSD